MRCIALACFFTFVLLTSNSHFQVGQLREGLDRDMAQCSSELDSDAVQDADARSKYNESYRPLAAATAAKPYWDKIATFRSTLQRAGESDQVVMQRLASNEATFADLNEETARTKMPRLQAPMVINYLQANDNDGCLVSRETVPQHANICTAT